MGLQKRLNQLGMMNTSIIEHDNRLSLRVFGCKIFKEGKKNLQPNTDHGLPSRLHPSHNPMWQAVSPHDVFRK